MVFIALVEDESAMLPLSQTQITDWFRAYQRRLRAGDRLPPLTEIADFAGCHRDAIYALLSGENISTRTQYGLSKAVRHYEEVVAQSPRTRLMHIAIGPAGARLGFGVGVGVHPK